MKQWIILAIIALSGVAAIFFGESRKVDVPPSPAALLYLVADSEHELTRMPMRFARMSDADEIRLGNGLAQFYSASQEEQKLPEFTAVEQYLTIVGLQVSQHAHRKLPYRFHYISNPYLINAFALPGGHVYVGRGLLSLMDSEDELAAVLGHEIEHIDHYHCAERAQQEQALRKIPLGGLVALPIEVFEAGYSKDQELEADREGTKLAVQAGYSANGAIRLFEAFDRLYREYQTRSKTPQQEASRLVMEALEGYFRSHPLPSERIAQVQKMIATDGWAVRPERDLMIAYIFWTARAQTAMAETKYSQAEQLAKHSLQLRADQPSALDVLAQAQFAQADFVGAAATYRNLLDEDQLNPELIGSYAHALAAANRKTAVVEFGKWEQTLKTEKPLGAAVASAGLALLAGHPEDANKMETQLNLNTDSDPQAVLGLGELGWWRYLNRDYQKAVDLLSNAVQQRPGDSKLRLHLAWTKIELRDYADALQTLNDLGDAQGQSQSAMAQAVGRWRAQQHDEALRDFATAVLHQPEWENSVWVGALYSPLVAHTVQEMRAERDRRQQKH